MNRATASLIVRRLGRDLMVLVLALGAARFALTDLAAGSYLTAALWGFTIFAMAYVVIGEWVDKGLTGTPRWARSKTEG